MSQHGVGEAQQTVRESDITGKRNWFCTDHLHMDLAMARYPVILLLIVVELIGLTERRN